MGWVLLKTISEEPLEGRPSTNVQRFRDLELQWWKARPSDELQMFVMQFGLQPKSMSFFGEVFFLLCGLKACVLLSNLPVMWRQSFASDVVLASGLLHLAPSVTTSRCSIALFEHVEVVEEQELAHALDYPVALSECKEAASMIEVGYFLNMGQHCTTDVLLRNGNTSTHTTRATAFPAISKLLYRLQPHTTDITTLVQY
ncbi:unnamed protein product [Peronospora belbahrii]|uniref:Uncharacterized protein n=1 Tax=Peronospora belbahrii TaxID=622444 RepID=A0AAU9L5M2_9STRA|nr:unnamed protein product [Peronospora belbahrii]